MFEKVLLNRFLCDVSGRGLLRNEQFGFNPSTALHHTRLVERVQELCQEQSNSRNLSRCG